MVSEVSGAAARFLRDRIDSLRELEMLLALRAAGARPITPEQLSAQLRANVRWTEEQLARMAEGGLVSTESDVTGATAYRYSPATSGLAAVLDEVAQLLHTRRLRVIELIFAEPDGDGGDAHDVR